jgi:tripartite-type tricarboxylate transporter receptor subunit TctC
MPMRFLIVLPALTLVLSMLPAAAQSSSQFYRGKTIFIDVGAEPGGAYDAYGRLIAKYIGHYIPGSPAVEVRNMNGAASMIAADHVYNRGPKDGTELGLVLHTLPITYVMNPGKFLLKPQGFSWIGTVASPTELLAVWHTAGVRSIEDAKKKSVTIGATTPGDDLDMFPRIADSLLGTKFNIVDGYDGGPSISLAMERGEVQGIGSNSWVSFKLQHSEWIRDNRIVPLFQSTFSRDPELPDVPTLVELARDEDQKKILMILTTADEIGNPLVAPPGVPSERIDILRRAFDLTTSDTGFLADAAAGHLAVNPIGGKDLQVMVTKMMDSSPELIDKFKRAVSPQS